MLRWFWYFSAVAALCIVGAMLYPAIVFADVTYIVCMYVVVDAFALAVGCSMLQKLNVISFWKFAAYLAFVVGTSVAINSLLSELAFKSLLLFALMAYMLLGSLNVALSRTILGVGFREASLIGLLVGLVHALVCIMATSVHV